jgi:hypothetical protein
MCDSVTQGQDTMSSVSNTTSAEPVALSNAEIAERRWMRFPADESRVFLYLQDGQELPASVRDESFGGMGVIVENVPAEFAPGFTLDVEYAGAPMGAVIRRVQRYEDGQTFLGLEWL